MKRTAFALLMTALLTLSLAACGSGGDSSAEEAGKYNMVSFMIGQFEIGANGQYLELKGNGKAILNDGDDTVNMTYAIDGTAFTLDRTGSTFTGTITGDVITLDIPAESFGGDEDADGLVWTFARDGSEDETSLKTEADAKGDLEAQMADMNLGDLTEWLAQYEGALDSEESEDSESIEEPA